MVPAEAAFCAQCGAPQVRVPESLTATAEPGNPATTAPERFSNGIPGTVVNWRHAWPAAASAGFAMAVAFLLLGPLFPLWMLAGGWIAVVLYRRRSSLSIMTSSIGGKVGALAGLLGFGFFILFITALLSVQGDQIRSMLRSAMDQAVAKNPDPQAQVVAQWLQTPEGLAFITLLLLVVFLLLSTAGGVFAASAGRRKLR